MSSTASRREAALRAVFLDAREDRQRRLQLALPGARGALLQVSANVPGPDKHRPGLEPLIQGVLTALQVELGLRLLHSASDGLGPFHLGHTGVAPELAKRACVALEARVDSGRILDLDVYRPDGTQVDRAALGLAPRLCLLCAAPARECILLKRHAGADLLARTDALLATRAAAAAPLDLQRLAVALHQGALQELAQTPKPGLVDRNDCGSHPDLSYAAMLTSANLLPAYYEDLLRCHRQGRPLADFIQAGLAAEQRMRAAIHSNAHKGYLFLSGLLLMAAGQCHGQVADLRPAIAALATRLFRAAPGGASHGHEVHARLGLAGIRGEAALGLPAVFEYGWPSYRQALAAGWAPDRAGSYLMAVLMGQVEDSTAAHRCGLAGLQRLRGDGAALLRLLEAGQPPEDFLAALNADYRALNLTMGGVADCMALSFALQLWVG